MRRACCKIALVLTAGILLSDCDGGNMKGSATPEAAGQFMALRGELDTLATADWMAEYAPDELQEVVQHFIQHADPTYTSATHKYSILHVACMLKKAELARCLLQDGAAPNAATLVDDSPAETPLLFALATDYAPQVTAEEINKLIDVLVAAGADLRTPGTAETSLAYNACLTCAHEGVYAHLLDIGAPRTGNELQEAAYRGWLSTLTRLMEEKGGLTAEDYPLLTIVARMSGGYFSGEHAACARYLLQSGVPVDATDECGRTALFCLAAGMSTLQESGMEDAAVELMVYLLQQGASPYARADKDPDYPGFCAYDLLAMNPTLLKTLQEKGFEFSTPGIVIRDGENLAADVCRAAMLAPAAEAIAPHYNTIAALLNTTTAQQEQQEFYADALRCAIVLLAQVDAARTTELVANMHLWKNADAMKPHNHTTTALLYALQDVPSIILPKEQLLQAARSSNANGAHENAAILVELTGRCPDSDELIDTLCNDPSLAIQAGAWGARLYKEKLPDASDGGVAAWLAAHGRSADTPVLQKALLLTSIEELWYGEMSPEKLESFVSAVRELGLPEVANIYRRIADNLSNPEVLDEIMSTRNIWAYQLEIAIARYMLNNKADIQISDVNKS